MVYLVVTPLTSVQGVSSKAKSSDFGSILEPLLEYIIVIIAQSDNLEQPHLPLHPRPLRPYKACSYEPVLSFEVWILARLRRVNLGFLSAVVLRRRIVLREARYAIRYAIRDTNYSYPFSPI